jgi:GTPase SAR1 family protein
LRKDAYVYKISIIGRNNDLKFQFGCSTSVGKFSNESQQSFIGIDTLVKQIEFDQKEYDISLILDIFSFSSTYKKMGLDHYKKSSGCIVIFDKAESDYEKKITYWIKELKEIVNTSIPIYIIGIKSAIEEEIDLKAKKLSEQLNASYYETTISDKEWIDNFFLELAIALDKQ